MTDRLRTAPLDTEHLVHIDDGHPEDMVVPRSVKELYEEGYPVEVVGRHITVNDKPDDDSSSYLVVEVETTSVKTEDADYAADKMTFFACSCWDFQARRAPLADENDGPLDAGRCKHSKRVAQRQKAAREQGQAALTEVQRGP